MIFVIAALALTAALSLTALSQSRAPSTMTTISTGIGGRRGRAKR
ncbi:MAG: hypothetical protein AAGC95_15765 [Pseudomonadota bacterium]